MEAGNSRRETGDGRRDNKIQWLEHPTSRKASMGKGKWNAFDKTGYGNANYLIPLHYKVLSANSLNE